MVTITYQSVKDIQARYPGQWTTTTNTWGRISTKVYGPFICMALLFYGQQVRWRIKQLHVGVDNTGELDKWYRTVSAGRALNLTEAIKHMEEDRLPGLISLYDFRVKQNNLREEVIGNVG